MPSPGRHLPRAVLARRRAQRTGRLGLARAHAVAGDAGQAREFTDRALAAAEDIADEEDRDLVLADLETIPGQPRYW
jgi:hypothetical protein